VEAALERVSLVRARSRREPCVCAFRRRQAPDPCRDVRAGVQTFGGQHCIVTSPGFAAKHQPGDRWFCVNCFAPLLGGVARQESRARVACEGGVCCVVCGVGCVRAALT